VRDPKTGHISKNFQEYSDMIGRLREVVPKMVLQVGGSISFAPEPGQEAKWQGYDTRHMLAGIDPKPDQVTVAIGSTAYDMTPLVTPEDIRGTQLEEPRMLQAYANMVADATPAFYVEHLKRLAKNGIQPYFALAHVHQLQTVERLIRAGIYLGPVNGFFSMVGGGVAGANPLDWMELIRRTPHGSVWTYQTMMRYTWPLVSFCITLGQHVRVGIEENLWGPTKGGKRMTTVQMIDKAVRMARELGRDIATAEQAHQILKIGTWYGSVDETLFNAGLPPNRPQGQQGFVMYDTDERMPKAARMDSSTLIL
jgi:uncharacterized protein (DUF849 family)